MTMCLKEDRECFFATFLSNTCLVLLHFADKKSTVYFPYIFLVTKIVICPIQELTFRHQLALCYLSGFVRSNVLTASTP